MAYLIACILLLPLMGLISSWIQARREGRRGLDWRTH